MSKKHLQNIAIVGGGILGLSLALRLAKAGKQVTLLEKGNDFGGLASGIKIENFSIERYYHHFFKSDIAMQALLEELGIADKLHWHPATSGLLHQDKLYNLSTSIELLMLPVLNIFQRLRLGLVSFFLQKTRDYQKFNTQTAIEWCRKYFGAKVTSVLWEPLLRGKFGKYFDQVSMSWLWARIYDRSSSRPHPLAKEYLGYIDGGFQLLVDTLVSTLSDLQVRLLSGITIKSYNYNAERHEVKWIDNQGREEHAIFDAVVSTVPGQIFGAIFFQDPKKYDQVKYLGASCMLLTLKKSLMPYYWLSVADDRFPFMAVIEHTNLIPKERYQDKIILYVAKYIDPQAELFQKDLEELLETYLPHLQKINPDFNLDWIEEKYLFKSAFAQHVVTKDYQIPDYKTEIPHLYYANFTQIFPHDRGTNYAVAQAEEIAKMLDNDN